MAEPQKRSRVPRATSEAEKSQRREMILAEADKQLRSVGIEKFSMEVLARQLGFARGTLYRYFGTREELLFGLYENKRRDLSEALLASVVAGVDDRGFLQTFYRHATADPLFLELQARLESVIEHNVSTELLIEAKLRMHHNLQQASGYLGGCLGLDVESTRYLLISLAALLLGASLLDASPLLSSRDLPLELQQSMAQLGREDLFLSNASLILESIRRQGGHPAER